MHLLKQAQSCKLEELEYSVLKLSPGWQVDACRDPMTRTRSWLMVKKKMENELLADAWAAELQSKSGG